MGVPDYNAPSALKAFLEERGMAMQKKFGQNFLINETIRNQLVDALQISPNIPVWEIGPGLGAMTKILLDKKADISVFEIDRGFVSVLHDIFSDYANFNLVEGDALKTWQREWNRKPAKRFFGNLPYNVAARLIADTIEKGVVFDIMVVTIQKEVALRMMAKPSSSDYSSFSILCQWAYDIKTIRDITPASFWPRPNVDSRALIMTKKESPLTCRNVPLFLALVRALFSSRRKTIKNNITAWQKNNRAVLADSFPIEEVLLQSDIVPSQRAENLMVKDFLRLSDTITSLMEEVS